MRSLYVLCALVASVGWAVAQTAADSAAIRATSLNYVEGWYEGNADRMAKAVHPELVKRIVGRDTLGNEWLSQMGASNLIMGTKRGGGKNTPKAQQQKDVYILDIFENTASVKAVMSGWIDYLHLVKWNGEWKIVNVLWELKPKK